MAYRYTCIKTFLADITAILGSQKARNSFMEGIMEGSLFYEMLSSQFYNVDSQELDFFNVMPACKKLVTSTMNIDNCQSDLNVVKNSAEGTRVPYTPIRKERSMQPH